MSDSNNRAGHPWKTYMPLPGSGLTKSATPYAVVSENRALIYYYNLTPHQINLCEPYPGTDVLHSIPPIGRLGLRSGSTKLLGKICGVPIKIPQEFDGLDTESAGYPVWDELCKLKVLPPNTAVVAIMPSFTARYLRDKSMIPSHIKQIYTPGCIPNDDPHDEVREGPENRLVGVRSLGCYVNAQLYPQNHRDQVFWT